MEVELKLALPARFATKIAQHRSVERSAKSASSTARLLSVYYDTPDFAVLAAGIALRVRRDSSGWVQTLKWEGTNTGGLHRRGESEMPLPDQRPNLEAIEQPELAEVFALPRVRKRIKPIFVTDFERTTRLLTIGTARVELSVDRGEIVCGTAREPICELELELLKGDAAVLFDLATELQASFPLRPLSRSKAERGYVLAGVKSVPVKAKAVVLAATESVAGSAVSILASGLAQLQANEHGALAGADPEYLHQMRVAVRRLRSALSAYADALPAEPFEQLRAELKWLGAALGTARDWDVLQTELIPALTHALASDAEVDALASAAQACRERSQHAARTAILSRRYARLILALGRALTTTEWRRRAKHSADPVLSLASQLLAHRYSKVVKRGAKLSHLGPGELHALRIAIKKLRYPVEFFATLFTGVRAQTFRERLAGLQECLGAINDQATLRRLAKLALPRNARLDALLTGWAAHIVHDERMRLLELWRDFRRARKFW